MISIFRFFWCIFTDPLLRPVHFPVQYVTLPKLHCSLRAFLLWLCHWPIIHSWEWWRSGRAQGQRPPYSYKHRCEAAVRRASWGETQHAGDSKTKVYSLSMCRMMIRCAIVGDVDAMIMMLWRERERS